jgi:hypothetical protein
VRFTWRDPTVGRPADQPTHDFQFFTGDHTAVDQDPHDASSGRNAFDGHGAS